MSRRMKLEGFDESVLAEFGEMRRDARVERKIIALRLVASGQMASEVGAAIDVNERTVRCWVKDFNRRGVESLGYVRYKGAKRRLAPEVEAELSEDIRRGPPKEMGLAVWRGWAMIKWVEKKYGVRYSPTGMYKLIHRLGFSSLMPRPRHPESDLEAQEAFKKNLARRGGRGHRPARAG